MSSNQEWQRLFIGLAVWAGIVLACVFLTTRDFITAAIAFTATFAGVFLSFEKESSRRQEEQQEYFVQVVQGLIHESENNQYMLEHIKEVMQPGTIYVGRVSIDVLRAALSDPLFHRWASNGLVVAATTVNSRLTEMNNILSDYMRRGVMLDGDVARVKIRAQKRQDAIAIMQELLHECGGGIVADKRDRQIAERLGRLLQEEREQTR